VLPGAVVRTWEALDPALRDSLRRAKPRRGMTRTCRPARDPHLRHSRATRPCDHERWESTVSRERHRGSAGPRAHARPRTARVDAGRTMMRVVSMERFEHADLATQPTDVTNRATDVPDETSASSRAMYIAHIGTRLPSRNVSSQRAMSTHAR